MNIIASRQQPKVVSFRWLRLIAVAAVIIAVAYFVFAQLENLPSSVQEQPILQTSATQTDPTATPLPNPSSITIPVGAYITYFDELTFTKMHQSGMTWISWYINEGDDTEDDISRIELAHAAGFKVLLMLGPNEQPNTTTYIEFIRQVASYQPDAIQVSNQGMTASLINPVSYTEFLKEVYEIVKATDPNIKVITGIRHIYSPGGRVPFTETSTYFQAMAEAGVANYADCIGVSFHGDSIPPDAVSIDPNNATEGYFVPTLEQAAQFFVESDIPLCLTYLGYTNATNSEKSSWLIQALQLANSYQSKHVEMAIVSYMGKDGDMAYRLIREDDTCPFCDLLAAELNP